MSAPNNLEIISNKTPIPIMENSTLNISPKLYPLLFATTWFDLHFLQRILLSFSFKLLAWFDCLIVVFTITLHRQLKHMTILPNY